MNFTEDFKGMSALVKIKTSNPKYLPNYATGGSVGLDLKARLDEGLWLVPGERKIIPTGVFVAIPTGMEWQIRPRSGNAAKFGITVLNSPGTIDSDYRGEVGVIIYNASQEPFYINDCDRIAQAVLCPVILAVYEIVAELDETIRGEGGFGHTGK